MAAITECDNLATMDSRDTLETDIQSVVVVVGGPPELVDAVQAACEPIPGAKIELASLRDAATKVAALWPFAIVMSDDVYGFDSEEFEALAKDVAARLITLNTDNPAQDKLLRKLRPLLREAVEARHE